MAIVANIRDVRSDIECQVFVLDFFRLNLEESFFVPLENRLSLFVLSRGASDAKDGLTSPGVS